MEDHKFELLKVPNITTKDKVVELTSCAQFLVTDPHEEDAQRP